jgi:uncharacterized damage-inducible protein DinB
MEFNYKKSKEVLTNTPQVIAALLNDLNQDWVNRNEGEQTWNVKEVVAHLIVCEENDWIPRINIILNEPKRVFDPIDMQAHFAIASDNSMEALLERLGKLRKQNLQSLEALKLSSADLSKTGTHPKKGTVSIQQLISTWVTHDLTHIAQICRIMAKQNAELVGSLKEYLKILNQ